MTIRHLEIFSAVCARGSVTQAAEILNMTPVSYTHLTLPTTERV